MMLRMRNTCSWCLTLFFWVSGALLLQQIWNYQKTLSDPLGSYIEFATMFFVTFYVLALFPIKHYVDWLLRRDFSSPSIGDSTLSQSFPGGEN